MFTLRRRAFLIALIAAACVPAAAAATPSDAPKILFVCQYGTVKSPIARELLRRHAAARRLRVSVASRGIAPEEHLPADVRERLTREGVDLASEPLQKLTQADLDQADVVVLFDKLPASFTATNVQDWTDLPSILNSYRDARTELDRRIDALVLRISR
jgi:protein-tyrosine-phosphatase